MKNRVKNGILYFFIISTILLIVLILINLFNYNTIVDFPSLDSFNKEIEKYSSEVSNLKDGTCKDFINTFIDKVKSINYEGKKDLKDIYNGDNSILMFYTLAKESCNFSDEKLKEEYIPTMYMSAILPLEYIYNEYIFGYELKIVDGVEKELKINLFNSMIMTKRNTELNIIEKYIELAKEVRNEE